MTMNWEEFMKGIAILYAFGLAEKDDWELKLWHRAIKDEMGLESYEQCCIHLCKNNLKFWETDNIPAQLLEIFKEIKQEIKTKLIAQNIEDDHQRRDREKQEAIDSYGSEEERLRYMEEFFKEFKRMFRSMDKYKPENEGVR